MNIKQKIVFEFAKLPKRKFPNVASLGLSENQQKDELLEFLNRMTQIPHDQIKKYLDELIFEGKICHKDNEFVLDYRVSDDTSPQIEAESSKTDNQEYELPISFVDLKNSELPEPEYLIDGFIIKKSIALIGSPRACFKSWFGIYLSICLSEGLDFLEKYHSKKCNILYLDAENGKILLKKRLIKICKGLGIEPTNTKSAFQSFGNLKLDSDSDMGILEKIIRENKIDVIVFDSFKRFHRANENTADEVSDLFTDRIRPLIEKHDLTLILIHHTKKKPVGIDVFDKMDFLRGSSEIPNLCDTIFMVERFGKEPFILLSNEKSRYGQELEKVGIRFNFEDNENSLKLNVVPESDWEIEQSPYYEKIALEWLRKEAITEFKTGELKEHFKSNNINCQNATISRTINGLVAKDRIKKLEKGKYRVLIEEQSTLTGK